MKKLLSVSLAILTLVCLMSINASAASSADGRTLADIEVLREGNYNSVIFQGDKIIYRNEPGIVDPVPHFEGNGSRASSIVVTASDVWRETRYVDSEPEFRAYGYVTAAQYHYARAEQHAGSWGVMEGVTNYGYNRVDSWTDYTYIDGCVAKIFYGAA